VSDLPTRLDEQPPFEHDVFADRQHSLLEHRANRMLQPLVQLRAPHWIGGLLDTEADFGEGYVANEERLERLRGNERNDPRIRGQLSQLGKHVRIQ
jgi:hypothetical protein